MRQLHRVFALLFIALLSACGDKTAAPEPAPAPVPAPDPHAGHEHGDQALAAPVAELPALAPNARVFFIEPAQGATITGPLENGAVSVNVKMGAENVAIKPAGPLEAGSGHHHVLIDASVPRGTVVPKDESHIHFGKGETEATIRVRPGAHKLTLQLADGIHRSYGEALSATIDVTVQAAGAVPATAQ